MKSRRRRRESTASCSTVDPSLSLSPSSGGDVDRLTELPDVLRLRILSLLPLKFAIRTGALSSRWRDFWRYRWPQPSIIDITAPPSLSQSQVVSAVEDFFSRRGRGRGRIDVLQIIFSPSPRHVSDLKRWLDYAAACSVSDLHLDLSPPNHFSDSSRRRRARAAAAASPILNFNCESPTLTRLSLRGFHLTSPPPSFKKLANLEILNLCEVYLSYASLRRILANCPLLRALSIRRCPDLKKVVVPSSALRLTRLTVVDCRKASEVLVTNLGLRSFRFSGPLLKNYHIESAAALEDVYISSGGAVPAMPRGDLVRPLGKLANLKVLTLCSLALEQIGALSARAEVGFRWLPNLVELQLLMVMMTESNLSDIYTFFKLCPSPKLEKVFVELPMNACDSSMKTYLEVPKEEPPKGGFNNLKVVKMSGFKGHLHETELAGFLLNNAGILEHFVVTVSLEHIEGECENHKRDLLQYLTMQLSMLPKTSAKADIILTESDDLQFRPVHSQI
ncbi:Putative FBD-associated F-box protein [Apostasia shenzhenica]|uniref:FBD-associated F-box protein n=1 Tax=Apostasia shenzhenica TaxID=1088818 RepID=A0A2I0ADB9_9ASPA|nr:Putative FBD-associated F-box protein [Apostasia shenzhenica]